MDKLLAKSGDGAATVAEHCRDVRKTGDAIWESVSADLKRLLPELGDNFPKLCAAAELLHDILKANTAYQEMVKSAGRSTERQPVRHEVLAVAFLTGEGPLAMWFEKLIPSEADRWAVIWAVGGHHFKMTDPARSSNTPLYRDKEVGSQITLQLAHADIVAILSDVAALFATKEIPKLADMTFRTAGEELRDRIDEYVTDADGVWQRLCRTPSNKTLIAVVKAFVAAADAAGSAVTERNLPLADWVRNSLGCRLTPADLEPVVQRDLKGNYPRPFQQVVADSNSSVTVVVAGCGNGKTTAAYLWAKKWGNGKKLFFTYPTTGTATAGYIGYLSLQKGLQKDLIHGRSEVDLASIRENPISKGNAREDEEDRKDQQREATARIESLRAWQANVVTCTIDTVLGLLQTQRRGVYSFPAFVAGAFVFDEIHAYDAKLWGGLLRFLKEFPGVPALLMSASIPPHRQKQLRDVLKDRFGEVIKGDASIEGIKRYRLEARDEGACWDDVTRALADGKKVLWVCNTVGDAIRIAGEAKKQNATPIVYHSRFRYRDRAGDATRKGRQREVLEEFEYHSDGPLKGQRVRPGPSLIIATQVCEMSLDISADLMVTAECPLPSLVQRLGRLNRYAKEDDPWTCLVYPFKGLPYNEDPKGIDLYGDCIASMAATRAMVKELAGQPCSQRDLAERLDAMVDAEEPDQYSALFDDGWVTEPMPVRDGDQSITVIREADVPEIEEKLGKNQKWWSAGKLAPWTIPMNYPKWLKPYDWPRAGPYPRVLDELMSYSEEEGAQWRKKS